MASGATTAQDHEVGFASFLVHPKRDRWLAARTNPRTRCKTLRRLLFHGGGWDIRAVVRLPPSHGVDHIVRELQARGAPSDAYLIAFHAGHGDGHFVPLVDAIRAVDGGDGGVFVSCVPGSLGYWKSEVPGSGRPDSFLFHRAR
jgi:hypothetical protein